MPEFTLHKDTSVDRMLEILRQHRMPALVEIVASWTVALGCLAYYGSNHLLFGGKVAKRLPLVTSTSKDYKADHDAGRLLQEQLAQQMNTTTDRVLQRAQKIVDIIRADTELRRLASDYLMTEPEPVEEPLYQLLYQHRNNLYRLPSIESDRFEFSLSIIIPAYKEHGEDVRRTLEHAYRQAEDPRSVQVIIVDAGLCPEIEYHANQMRRQNVWGQLQIIQFYQNTGRGPTLNAGAQEATGRLLTFLHSDTLLPHHWDAKVKQTLGNIVNGKVTHACAFSFGHNLSREGLGSLPFPHGISAIDFLGNLRAWWFKLPYGDHVISFPANFFWFVGGFPNQPIMEDYQIMDLFRNRASFLPERLEIIDRPAAMCSVRRWQRFGVVYTTLVNLLIVYRYRDGWSVQEIFDYYYRRPFQSKDA